MAIQNSLGGSWPAKQRQPASPGRRDDAWPPSNYGTQQQSSPRWRAPRISSSAATGNFTRVYPAAGRGHGHNRRWSTNRMANTEEHGRGRPWKSGHLASGPCAITTADAAITALFCGTTMPDSKAKAAEISPLNYHIVNLGVDLGAAIDKQWQLRAIQF